MRLNKEAGPFRRTPPEAAPVAACDLRTAAAAFTRTHRAPAPLPVGVSDPADPILIEGTLEGNLVEVLMPGNECWRFTMGNMCAALCTVLCVIDPTSPYTARIHRPGLEGIHPFLGTAHRFGVEKGVEA
ncbi:hypothetical protein HNR46_001314 [Haloferula luteola]|uniref:Uncharacterized protein n=1 Tax=Haloferula luteola TaxID=595692 RepID=A0A840VAW2_9BACT|nr:hypothetical protein [Haloferula luteola]MBB5351080.1 hypothetical protein [Haloferula luteola]